MLVNGKAAAKAMSDLHFDCDNSSLTLKPSVTPREHLLAVLPPSRLSSPRRCQLPGELVRPMHLVTMIAQEWDQAKAGAAPATLTHAFAVIQPTQLTLVLLAGSLSARLMVHAKAETAAKTLTYSQTVSLSLNLLLVVLSGSLRVGSS